jgi:hypothetical protein
MGHLGGKSAADAANSPRLGRRDNSAGRPKLAWNLGRRVWDNAG